MARVQAPPTYLPQSPRLDILVADPDFNAKWESTDLSAGQTPASETNEPLYWDRPEVPISPIYNAWECNASPSDNPWATLRQPSAYYSAEPEMIDHPLA
ncbi:hypothetical protein H4R34_000224 [Dimargaris verticillata]|uniref:Uncharacterized protein n=1 Tax=Dimargaris verticillata TaxID=2761393 RepID=A0A9W8EG55_9FUNG|nr:hypothetical protein H4R34_000224 [Dimargaris verticillata]